MMTQEPVLRRKVLRPRPRPAPEDGRSALARALPRALVRAVSAGAGLTAQVALPTEQRQSLDEVLDLLPEDGFVALLTSGAGDGGTGLAVLDQALFSGLIEAMTLGRLSARPPAARRATATDSALLGAVVDQALSELAGVAPDAGTGGAEGPMLRWHMARAVSDLRLLGAMLDECHYRMLSARVHLTGGEGQREGALLLFLPVQRRTVTPVQTAGDARTGPSLASVAGQGPDDPFQSALELAVLGAPVQLNTVLGRIPMTLSDAMALSVGQRLELPLAQLEEVQLIGLDGQPHAQARLGQSRGMRALRIIALAEGTDGGSDARAGGGALLEGRAEGAGLTPQARPGNGQARAVL